MPSLPKPVVLLNACYSAGIADALLTHVDRVVGMRGAISDEAARAFAMGFLGALADEGPVATACAQGKAAIGLEVLNGLAEVEGPQLRFRSDDTWWLLAAHGLWPRIHRTVSTSNACQGRSSVQCPTIKAKYIIEALELRRSSNHFRHSETIALHSGVGDAASQCQ